MKRAELNAISRVLADPRRFEILKSIASRDCAACADLRREFPITAATLFFASGDSGWATGQTLILAGGASQ